MKTIEQLKFRLCDMIQARVEELDLTQREAATKTGYQQARFSEIKRGRSDLGVNGLLRILEGLGLNYEILLRKVK